jgi:hypothetical protein
MVAMQVAYKYITDFVDLDPGLSHAQLGAFPTIDQEIIIVNLKYLRSLISIESGCC